ncbi:MAG: PilN domain-containing protein [Gemmatimonadota bacterium]
MIEVNLFPEQQRQRKGRRTPGPKPRIPQPGRPRDRWGTALRVVGVLAPAAVLFLWWTQRSQASDLESRLEVATADSARLAELRQVSDSLTARREEIRRRVALIEQLDGNRFVWPHMLDEVSRALPRFAWLTNLQRRSPTPEASLQIQGVAPNPLAITEFVRNLEASEYITDVRIMGSQKQELGDGELVVQAFTLTARYRTPAPAGRTEPIVASRGD